MVEEERDGQRCVCKEEQEERRRDQSERDEGNAPEAGVVRKLCCSRSNKTVKSAAPVFSHRGHTSSLTSGADDIQASAAVGVGVVVVVVVVTCVCVCVLLRANKREWMEKPCIITPSSTHSNR
jgi:hypothetical protein